MATIVHNEQVLVEVQGNIDRVIRDIGIECLNRVTERTPVDTGHARSRWVMTNNPTSFTLSNDADYISFLEEGSSTQAPLGMLGVTMFEVPAITDEVVRKYNKD